MITDNPVDALSELADKDMERIMVVLIYDVHASESGALSILNDLYKSIADDPDKNVKYIFAVSVPEYEDTDNILVLRYPWVKKSWFHRIYFDNVTTRFILSKYKPDKVFSLQNKGISFFRGKQEVYLHLPSVLCDYRFKISRDGVKLWLYQNVLSKSIFKSLRKVDKVIVQTNWMKDALIKKAGVKSSNIIVEAPNILMNDVGIFNDTTENRNRFFYPATAFSYKNHMTILKALNNAQSNGFKDYEMIFTIKKDDNKLTKELYSYANEHNLNVIFGGPIPREKVFEMFTKSVLIFPSFVESFGLPLLEARLTGTYIFASDCPFSREILDGYDKAVFFEPMDYEFLSEKIRMS